MRFNLVVVLCLLFSGKPRRKDISSRQVLVPDMEINSQEDQRIPLTPPQTIPKTDQPLSPTSQVHTKAGLILLATLSVVEAVIPTLGLYRPFATGLLYLPRLAPILYWSLASSTPPPVQQS